MLLFTYEQGYTVDRHRRGRSPGGALRGSTLTTKGSRGCPIGCDPHTKGRRRLARTAGQPRYGCSRRPRLRRLAGGQEQGGVTSWTPSERWLPQWQIVQNFGCARGFRRHAASTVLGIRAAQLVGISRQRLHSLRGRVASTPLLNSAPGRFGENPMSRISPLVGDPTARTTHRRPKAILRPASRYERFSPRCELHGNLSHADRSSDRLRPGLVERVRRRQAEITDTESRQQSRANGRSDWQPYLIANG